MTFAEYSRIMKEHGIGELFFLYKDKQCSISMGIQELNIYYAIYNGETSSFFDNLEALFYTEKFEGKTLEAIWSEVVILEIDGVSLEEYDVDT